MLLTSIAQRTPYVLRACEKESVRSRHSPSRSPCIQLLHRWCSSFYWLVLVESSLPIITALVKEHCKEHKAGKYVVAALSALGTRFLTAIHTLKKQINERRYRGAGQGNELLAISQGIIRIAPDDSGRCRRQQRPYKVFRSQTIILYNKSRTHIRTSLRFSINLLSS